MNHQEHEPMQPNEHTPEKEILPAPVYFIESDTDTTVLVGIDVQRTGDIISWYDTTKKRIMRIEAILDSRSDHFVFRRGQEQGGQVYTFTPMNLEIYNTSVKNRLFNGSDFTDDQSMIAALIATKDTY